MERILKKLGWHNSKHYTVTSLEHGFPNCGTRTTIATSITVCWYATLIKKNVYLPSLMMKVPNHLYVSNLTFHSVLFSVFSIPLLFNGIDACIGHTCNTTRVQHDTVIPCASSYSVYYYISSHTPSATRATIRLRNAFRGQQCEKQRTEFWRHDLTVRLASSYQI
jgi:hypothetical protein